MFDSRAHLLGVPPGPELARLLAAVDVDGLDADATLTFLQAVRRQEAWTESLRLSAAARFAEIHDEVPGCSIPGSETLIHLGGEGTPMCGSFTADELGPELAMSRYSAARLIADALDLKYRLPGVLMAMRMGGTDAYRARLVASGSRDCTAATAAKVEDRVLPRLDRLTRAGVARIVAETTAAAEPDALEQKAETAARSRHVSLDGSCGDDIDVWATMAAGAAIRLDARVDQVADMLDVLYPNRQETKDQRRSRALGLLADPHTVLGLTRRYRELTGRSTDDPADPADAPADAGDQAVLLPATTLYVHLRPDGLADLEQFGVMVMSSVRDLLTGSQVTVKPVIDLAHMAPSTGYRPSDKLREGIIVANPRCIFPYCDRDSRKTAQLDHTLAYPHGQTEADNLGPPCDRHHRVKTHGRGWRLRQPFRGIFVWRSPTGRIYVVDHQETLALRA